MTDDSKQSVAVATVMRALDWAYDKAVTDLPGLGSAVSLAESHLKNCGNDRKKAIDELVAWQVGYAGATGFVTNLGGIVTLPVAIPANVAGVFFIQLRLIAAIAHINGHDVSDERVRTLAYICLTGSSAATILQDFGVKLGTKLSAQVISKIPGTILFQINRAVGFRLVTKAGSQGLINLTKVLPFVGGVVGGAWDAGVTRGVAAVAKDAFKPLSDAATVEPIVIDGDYQLTTPAPSDVEPLAENSRP